MNMVSGYVELEHEVSDGHSSVWVCKIGSHRQSSSLKISIKLGTPNFDARKGTVVYLSGELETCRPQGTRILVSAGSLRTVQHHRKAVASRQSPAFSLRGTIGHLVGTPHTYLFELELVGAAGLVS